MAQSDTDRTNDDAYWQSRQEHGRDLVKDLNKALEQAGSLKRFESCDVGDGQTVCALATGQKRASSLSLGDD